MANSQINFFDEIIIDNFAGGGGASTGIELAIGRPVTVAINHDPAAILMHKTNHPYTLHLQDNVWNIDPVKICEGRPVGLAWFSPDCKHFSKAKGSALVDKNIRGLAWIVLKWAGTVRPRIIMLENVEEFKTWGPVRKGKPIKNKSGQTFERWKRQLSDLGYEIEYKELIAADYGAPTSRKRFVLIARCDGEPIVWPERTHAPAESPEVKSGKYKPWRSAAEVIDWNLPCPSIFETSAEIKEKYGLKALRPLKENTLRRITRGIDKFVIKNSDPFIIPVAYGDKSVLSPLTMHNHTNACGTHIKNPINTITTAGAQMLIAPHLSKYFGGVVGEDVKNPLPTVTAIDHHALISPTLIQYHTEQSNKGVRASGLKEPVMTIDSSPRYGIAAAHLTQYFKGDHYHSPEAPLHTVTTEIREGVTLGYLTEFKGKDIGQNANNPLRTITTSAGEFGAVQARLEKISGSNNLKYWPLIRELLNKFAGYDMAPDEILVLTINGIDYFISDIGLRMLTPKELYAAQGFPEDYIIDKDYTGKDYRKTHQVARCGNAVCPPMAKALVMANMPEYCVVSFNTMATLTKHIAI